MTLKLYNTLTRKKEIFKPINKNEVKIYSCGPTIHDYAHIGNFRAFLFADTVRRYIKYKEYKVYHVMNLTDVDDKIIKKCQEQKLTLKEFTEKYEKAFFEDLDSLNIEKVENYPKATEHTKEMFEIIQKLLDNSLAYLTEDGIYYDISKFKSYGKLGNIKINKQNNKSRIKKDEYDKDNIQDFALWKFWNKDDGEVKWEYRLKLKK